MSTICHLLSVLGGTKNNGYSGKYGKSEWNWGEVGGGYANSISFNGSDSNSRGAYATISVVKKTNLTQNVYVRWENPDGTYTDYGLAESCVKNERRKYELELWRKR